MMPRRPLTPREAAAEHQSRVRRREDHEFQWKITLVTSGLSLVIALAGMWATLHVATTQIHAQAKQDQASFIRTQRQASYSRLFQANNALGEQERDLWRSCDHLNQRNNGKFRDQLEALSKQSTQVGVEGENVGIIGSIDAFHAASDLFDAHSRFVEDLLVHCREGFRTPPKGRTISEDRLMADQKAANYASAKFMHVAAVDLQSPS